MSSQPARPLRRERRAATLAARREQARTPVRQRPPFGIGTMTIASLILGLLIVGAVFVLNRPAPPDLTVVRAMAPTGIATSGRTLGAEGAPVVIKLYEDFQCPACARWGVNILPGLVSNELAAGTVRIEFHGFAFLGPESKAAEQAAWAAEQQGRFWDMWATLYANQGIRENAGAFDRDRLIAMADVLGLDATRFATDLDAPEAARSVADGVAAAAAAGVNSTPSLFVAGVAFRGSTYPELAAAIAAAAAAGS